MTFFERCRAAATNPIRSNSAASWAGSGPVYSTNSNPSVPVGLSHSSWTISPPARRAEHRSGPYPETAFDAGRTRLRGENPPDSGPEQFLYDDMRERASERSRTPLNPPHLRDRL